MCLYCHATCTACTVRLNSGTLSSFLVSSNVLLGGKCAYFPYSLHAKADGQQCMFDCDVPFLLPKLGLCK